MKKGIHVLMFTLLIINLQYGQGFVPVIEGLAAPAGVESTPDGIWVTVTGSGNNDGMVLQYAEDGTVDTLVSGLSSFFDSSTMETVGPWRATPWNETGMLLVQGEGPDTLYSASLIIFDTLDISDGPMTYAHASQVLPVGAYALSNGFEESNPFSAVVKEGSIYIADAAANAIIKYDMVLGEYSVFATFPPFDNPTPVGPPVVDVVPTRIISAPEGGFYVSSLTGFPFISGASSIYHLDDTGAVSVAYDGLTLVTDIGIGPDSNLVALQFASFGEMGFDINSAQLISVDSAGMLDTLISGFGPSPGFTYNADGDLYASHLFFGQLLAYDENLVGALDVHTLDLGLIISPNPASDRISLQLDLDVAMRLDLLVYDISGRLISSRDLDQTMDGRNNYEFSKSELRIDNAGLYHFVITNGKGLQSRMVFFK